MKNLLTLNEINLYLEKVIKKGKPICLQLNYPGSSIESIDFAKTGFSIYIVKAEITKEDL